MTSTMTVDPCFGLMGLAVTIKMRDSEGRARVYFYSLTSGRNISIALQGRDQTNQRAELLAVLEMFRRDPIQIEIRTHSEYAVNGVERLPFWRPTGWKGEHGDLWDELGGLIDLRNGRGVKLTKVLGHAKPKGVTKGADSIKDKEGNDAADALAVAAAMAHAPPQHLVDETHERQANTTATQKMMLRTLHVRFNLEHCDENNLANAAMALCSLVYSSDHSQCQESQENDALFDSLPVEIEPG